MSAKTTPSHRWPRCMNEARLGGPFMSARTAPCNEFTEEGKMRLSFRILSALVAFSTVVLSDAGNHQANAGARNDHIRAKHTSGCRASSNPSGAGPDEY